MNVTTSTNVYSYVQNTTGSDAKITSSQPAVASSTPEAKTPSSGHVMISGQGLMMSRLFGNRDTNPPVQTQLTQTTSGMDAANFLTLDDRSMLSDLYAQAQDQGTDLRYVDDLARDLGKYRKFGSVSGNYNTGNTYDESGHKQTISFDEKDAITASRIINSGNASSSFLDPGFLKYELDPGYSFDHVANFEYIESLVNNPGQTATQAALTQGSRFSSYVSQGQNNFVVNTASEVTLHTEEPDFVNVDGVFSVTKTGMHHGFQLEGGNVVQNKKLSMTDIQYQGVSTLFENFSSKEKIGGSDSDQLIKLFYYHFLPDENKKQ